MFPSLFWLGLWLITEPLADLLPFSTDLLSTFFLPLVSLFWFYSLVAVLILILFGEEVYNPLVKRFMLPVLITYMVIQTLGLFTEISLLAQTQLFTFAQTTFTLGNLFVISVGLVLWFTGVNGLSQLLRKVLISRMKVEEGSIDASLILLRYFMIALGAVIIFSELPIDATAIAAISGGLAVGVGLSLQDLLSNFFSGLMLLFERSLHPGDIIEIDGQLGRVQDINIRAATIRTIDNVEVVIPNQHLFNENLTSYTRNNRIARFCLEVPAACEHNPDEVISIILDVTDKNPQILTSLTAEVEVVDFGEDSINYKLQVWTDHPLIIDTLRSDLYRQIWQAFSENGIEMSSTDEVYIRQQGLGTTETTTTTASQQISNLLLKDNGESLQKTSLSSPQLKKQPHLSESQTEKQATPQAQSQGKSQIELVETSFEKIKPYANEFAASFYQNLFRAYPKVRPMFAKTNMAKQQQKLLQSLVLLVENVRRPSTLKPVLKGLGAKHKNYGVIVKHYPLVGEILLQTLEEYLQEDWTEEVKEAWTDTYLAVSQIMLSGAEGVQSTAG